MGIGYSFGSWEILRKMLLLINWRFARMLMYTRLTGNWRKESKGHGKPQVLADTACA